MKSLIYSLLLVLVGSGIAGCTKDDTNDSGSSSFPYAKSGLDIPRFDTYDDLFLKIQALSRMGEDERRQYEVDNGYKSLLTSVYEIYEGIDLDSLGSEKELTDYIDENSTYVTLRENEESEKEYHPYFSDNEFSVVVGANRLLIVEDMCYKIFDDGILITSVDDMHLLTIIDDPYGEGTPPNELIIPGIVSKGGGGEPAPSPTCHSNSNIKRVTSGSNRTKLKLRCYSNPLSGSQTEVRTLGRIRPYKKIFGVWCHARRTISGQITYSVKYLRGTTHEINVNENISPTLSYSQTRWSSNENPENLHASNIRFVSISSNGTTPSTGVASISCSN